MTGLRIAVLGVSVLFSLSAEAEVIRFELLESNSAYVAAVRSSAARMVAERLLLPQDAERAVELATQDKLSQLH